MTETIVTERPHRCDITVWREEDWYDPLPPIADPETGDPLNLAGMVFELHVRRGDDGEAIFTFSSEGEGILIDDAAAGLVSLHFDRASVNDHLPVGEHTQFLTIAFADPEFGASVKTLWRGKFTVLPGRVDDETLRYVPLEIDRLEPRRLDIEARQTEDFEMFFQVFDRGYPYDLSGGTYNFVIRPTFGHAETVVETVVEVVDADAGKMRVRIAQGSVEGAPAGRWTYMFYGVNGFTDDREYSRGAFIIAAGNRL